MVGKLFLIALGIATISLGSKGFTPKGLPFNKDKNLTGPSAKIVGTICIAFGLALIGFVIVGSK